MNDLRVAAPLTIYCWLCHQTVTIPCRSDSTQEADGTWRMVVHLNHDALQAHFDTHEKD